MKTFEGAITLTTPPLESAKLVWSTAQGTEYPLAVVNHANGTSTVSTTAALPRGVLKLCVKLADTTCCPRTMQVWSTGCAPTVLPGAHNGGSQLDTGPVPSCNPA